MQFVITGRDGENMLERRMSVRPRHLENMGSIKGKVLFAGGIQNEEGKPIGSVMVIDFESKELLDEYLASEPYIQEKVWEKVTAEPINAVIVDGKKVGK